MRSKLPVIAKTAPIMIVVLCLVLAPAANACPTQSTAMRLNALNMSARLRPAPAQLATTQTTANNNGGSHGPAIVGMWEVTLLTGGAVYDLALQQFHADGINIKNSRILPPILYNTCWTEGFQTGSR